VGTEHDLDFSASTAPDSWYEAAAQAPQGAERPVTSSSFLPTLPSSRGVDLAMACLTTLAMSVACGYAWYQIDTTQMVRSPWLAVALGVMIAVAVRLGGGRRDRETRAALAGLFYVVTLLSVAFLATRHSYVDLYGSSPSLVSFEEELFRSRFSDPWTVVAWFAGAVTAVKLSLLLGDRY
jgi:hypothetical protein